MTDFSPVLQRSGCSPWFSFIPLLSLECQAQAQMLSFENFLFFAVQRFLAGRGHWAEIPI
jgi:hypothetical protein